MTAVDGGRLGDRAALDTWGQRARDYGADEGTEKAVNLFETMQ